MCYSRNNGTRQRYYKHNSILLQAGTTLMIFPLDLKCCIFLHGVSRTKRGRKMKDFFFSMGIELTAYRVYSHTLMHLRHDWSHLYLMFLKHFFYKLSQFIYKQFNCVS